MKRENMKKIGNVFLAVSIVMYFMGSTLYAEDSVKDWAEDIEIKHNDFKKMTTYVGDDIDDVLWIRAWKKDKDKSIDYQIYIVEMSPISWSYYDEIYDSNGLKLDMTFNDRKANQTQVLNSIFTTFIERTGIRVTRQYLEDNKLKGIHFQAGGATSEKEYKIPPNYIQAFLSVVE